MSMTGRGQVETTKREQGQIAQQKKTQPNHTDCQNKRGETKNDGGGGIFSFFRHAFGFLSPKK